MQVLDEWLLTPQRVAVHLPTRTAVVADLHLGYDEARRRAGEAVPVVPLGRQLARLQEVLAHHGLRRLAVAGDLLEDGRCQQALQAFRDWLASGSAELVGVAPGNHDRAPENAQALGDCLVREEGVAVGRWRVVHGDGPLPPGLVVQGHEHPCVRWRQGPTAPCYLVAEGRLVLPAYSADAAGVNVLGARRWRDFRCCVLGAGEVLDFGPVGNLRRLRAQQ
jgi:putative SbcD/Mre11-related phosphoesterase